METVDPACEIYTSFRQNKKVPHLCYDFSLLTAMTRTRQPRTITSTLRAFLLAVLLLGMAGTAAELLLIGHFEDAWQWTPLLLFALCVVTLAWYGASRSAASLRALQAVMLLFIVSGGIGFWLHMQAKIEFQLEVNPSLAGMALYRKALESVSPPALAPGMMIQLGLLGLAFAYRHPALSGSVNQGESSQ